MSTDTAPLTPAEADGLLASTILTDEGRQDPYSAYARLRAGGGRWETAFGALGLAGYQDCIDVLRHPKLGRPEPDMELPAGLGARDRRTGENEVTMLFLNPPDHTRIRGLVSRAFTPKRVEELRPEIEALLAPVLDRFAAEGGGDVMAELAIPFPVAVISELLGVPSEGNEHIRPMVHAITAFIDPAADDETLARAAGRPSGAVRVLHRPDRGEAVPPRRPPAQRADRGGGGRRPPLVRRADRQHAAALRRRVRDHVQPDRQRPVGCCCATRTRWDRLRADRSLLPSAMWEILRADSPVQLNNRVVLEEVELFGRTFGPGVVLHRPAGLGQPRRRRVPRRRDASTSGGSPAPTCHRH